MNPSSDAALPPTEPVVPRELSWDRPLHWLRLGLADLLHCPLPGLLHGLAAALFGVLLFVTVRKQFWLLAGAFSGFLIVAPLLATGLYRVSKRLEREGRCTSLAEVARVWLPKDSRMVRFGLLLALAGTGWVITSASLVYVRSAAPIHTPEDFLHWVVLNDQSHLFELWLGLGGLLAAPVFASSVVALPMLLDRPVGVIEAVLTSWRCVLANPAAMALWAGLIMLLVLVGMLTALAGLVFVLPLLAHASWHAYRELVPDSASPAPAAARS